MKEASISCRLICINRIPENLLLLRRDLIPPLNSLQGLGLSVAQSIVDGRNDGEFRTIEEFKSRTSAGASIVELLKENGVLKRNTGI